MHPRRRVSVLNAVWFLSAQGEKDWQKYETARRLKKIVDRIRAQYREDWKSKEMRIRQRAVALYFIDKVSHDPPLLLPGHSFPPLSKTVTCALKMIL